MDEGVQYQRHRALMDEEFLAYLSHLPKHLVPMVVSIYEYELEFADVPEVRYLTAWRKELMRTYVSGGGRGRDDIVTILRGVEDEVPHRDRGTLPTKRDGLPMARGLGSKAKAAEEMVREV